MMPTKNAKQEPVDSSAGLSSEQIVELGQAAAQLLGSPIYNHVYAEQMRVLHEQWLTSEAHEEKKRNGLYFQARGLMEVTDSMGGLAQQAQQILQDQAQGNKQGLDTEYLDRQGFQGTR